MIDIQTCYVCYDEFDTSYNYGLTRACSCEHHICLKCLSKLFLDPLREEDLSRHPKCGVCRTDFLHQGYVFYMVTQLKYYLQTDKELYELDNTVLNDLEDMDDKTIEMLRPFYINFKNTIKHIESERRDDSLAEVKKFIMENGLSNITSDQLRNILN